MRIQDLFENKLDKFVKYNDGKAELQFNLAEDLAYFMHNDDDSYRRHLYPVLVKCVHDAKKNRNVDPKIFKTSALESYKNYLKQFPIRELPEDLDDKLIKEVCEKLHDDFVKDIEEGKYKD